jgi:histidinol-phosphate aminotransferase
MSRLDRRQALRLAHAAGAAMPLAPALAPAAAPRPGASRAGALRLPLRLSANENPWGPGPAARAALAAATDEASRYGFDVQRQLQETLARNENVPPEQIVIGSGSGELLQRLALAYCERGTLNCAWPTFNQLQSFAEKLGAQVVKVPLDATLRHDLDALAAATTPNTSLLYVCNPNNPTGTVIAAAPLRAFCAAMAQRTLVVVDEAYLELAEPGTTASMVDLARGGANVVVLRTFSKLHGLAGLRIGYAVANPEVALRLRRLSLATPSIVGLAAAQASLGDTAFLARARQSLLADRQRIHDACRELGLEHTASQGNFVFMKTGMTAEAFRERMRAEQMEVGRPFEPLNDYSRVSVGTTDETTAFIAALRRVVRS